MNPLPPVTTSRWALSFFIIKPVPKQPQTLPVIETLSAHLGNATWKDTLGNGLIGKLP